MKVKFFLLIFLIPLLGFTQKKSKKEETTTYYEITIALTDSIKVVEISKNGIHGIYLQFFAKVKSFSVPVDKVRLKAKISFLTPQRKFIVPEDKYTKYLSSRGHSSLIDTFYVERNNKDVTIQGFIPYYALKLPPGKQKIMIFFVGCSKIDTIKGLIIKTILKRVYYVVEINKPKTKKISYCIGKVEVSPYDSLGNAWDNGMFNESEERPDISVALYTGEIRYKFPVVKNSYMADFENKCSPEIVISEMDTPKIMLIDVDNNDKYEIIDYYLVNKDKENNIIFPYMKQKGKTKWTINRLEYY